MHRFASISIFVAVAATVTIAPAWAAQRTVTIENHTSQTLIVRVKAWPGTQVTTGDMLQKGGKRTLTWEDKNLDTSFEFLAGGCNYKNYDFTLKPKESLSKIVLNADCTMEKS